MQNARNRESAITDTQPSKENSEGDELMLSVVLDGTDKQHHDTIPLKKKIQKRTKVRTLETFFLICTLFSTFTELSPLTVLTRFV